MASCANKYVAVWDRDVGTSDSHLVEPERVTSGNESNFAATLSSNERFVIYASDREGHKNLWERQIGSSQSVQLTFNSADDYSPAVSPNGRYLAFISRRSNASGDLQIMSLGPLRNLFRRGEKRVATLHQTATIDSFPSWLPDSSGLVFVSRSAGEAVPRLLRWHIGNEESEPIEGLHGDHPAVHPSGDAIVYQRRGALYYYNFQDRIEHRLTDGIYAKDGHPSFTQDGQRVIFIRYLHDTNSDGQVNAEDRGAVWELVLPSSFVENSTTQETVGTRPLSANHFSAYFPREVKESLYFSQQMGTSLDVFRLPKTGQLLGSIDYEDLVLRIESESDTTLQRFLYFRGGADLYRAGDTLRSAEINLRKLFHIVEREPLSYAKWQTRRILNSFNENSVKLRAKSLLLLAEARHNKIRRSSDNVDIVNQIDLLVEEAREDKSSDRAVLWLEYIRAELFFLEGRVVEGENLARTLRAKTNDADLKARLLMLEVNRHLNAADPDNALPLLIQFASDHPERRTMLLQASTNLVALAERSQWGPVEFLLRVRERTSELPIIAALAHQRSALEYRQSGEQEVLANELRKMLYLYYESPEVFFESLKLYLEINEAAGRHQEIEAELKRLWQEMPKSNMRIMEELQDITVRFHLRRAEGLMRQREPGLAISEYRKSLSYDEFEVAAHRGLIDGYAYRGMANDAIAIYQERLDRSANDDLAKYLYAYAVSYSIDSETNVSRKLRRLDYCISHIEEAIERSNQRAAYHQTLGWLYQQRARTLAEYRQSGFGKVNRSWAITKEFFGIAEHDWNELAVDSYLVAYFLSEPGSVEQANLSQNLAEAYFAIGNYGQALRYYMERLSLAERIPLRHQMIEAVILQNAGRSAFDADELALAQLVQGRAVTMWRQIGDDVRVAEALDRLALTLRERGEYAKALEVYKELLSFFVANSDDQNQANTLVNMAYAALKAKEFDAALTHAESAEKLIGTLAGSGGIRRKGQGSITIDMAGEGSATSGFDNEMRLILLETLRADVFRNKGRLDLEYHHTKAKQNLVASRRSRLVGRFTNQRNLAPELATANNNLAMHVNRLGLRDQAASLFLQASQLGETMRPARQPFMTRDEWLNLANYISIRLEMFQIGEIDIDELQPDWLLLKKNLTDLLDSVEQGNLAELSGAQRLSLLAKRWPAAMSLEEDQSFTQRITEFLTIESVQNWPIERHASVLWTNAENNVRFDSEDGEGAIAKSFRRRLSQKGDAALWSYFVRLNLIDEAREAARSYVYSGGLFDKRISRKAIHDFYYKLASRYDEATSKLEVYRELLEISLYETANRVYPGHDLGPKLANMRRLDLSELYENLSVLVLIENPNLEFVEGILLDSGEVEAAYRVSTASGLNTAVLELYRKIMVRSQSVLERVYVVSNISPLELDLASIESGGDRFHSFLPSFELVRYSIMLRNLSRLSVTELGSEKYRDSVGSDLEYLVVGQDVDHGNVRIPDANIIIFGADTFVHSEDARYETIKVSPYEREEQQGSWRTSFGLKQLSLELPSHASIVLIPNLMFSDTLSSAAKREYFYAIGILGAIAQVPTIALFPRRFREKELTEVEREIDSSSKNGIAGIFSVIDKESLADALMQHNEPLYIIGDLGLTTEGEQDYIESVFEETLYDAEDAFDDGQIDKAIALYRRHLFHARRMRNETEIMSAQRNLVQLLFLQQRFSEALHYQMAFLDSLKGLDAPLADATMDAAVLAVRAEQFKLAQNLLDSCLQLFTKDEDYFNLGRTLQYVAINFENQGEFAKTIDAYKESRVYHELDYDAELAAERLLNIANVYRERLADYREALSFYRLAVEEFTEDFNFNAVQRVQVDYANTLMTMGRVQDAIEILENIQGAIDQENDLVSWLRNAQILSNAYYQAGQYSSALAWNQKVLAELAAVTSTDHRLRIQLDASNLQAMLLAKLGDVSAALAVFRDGIVVARENNLQADKSLRLSNIGFWLREDGQYAESIDYFLQALAIDERRQDARAIAYDYRNIGLSYVLLGNLNEARSYLELAKTKSRELRLAYNLAYTHFGLAEIHGREQDLAGALRHLEAALEVSQQSYLQDFIWRAHSGLAQVYQQNQQHDLAAEHYQNAIDMIERLRGGLESDSSRTGFTSDRGVQSVYQDYAVLLFDMGRIEQSWAVGERARARSFIDSIGSRASSFEDETTAKLFDELQAIRRSIEDHHSDPATSQVDADYQRLLAEEKRLTDRLREVDAQAIDLAVVAPIELTDFQMVLGDNTGVIQYLVTDERLLIWVLYRNSIKARAVEVSRSKLVETISRYRQFLQSYSSMNFIASELSEILIQPVAELLPPPNVTLGVIPHDALHYLSFSSLPFESGYLLDKFPLFYLESATLARYVLVDQKIDDRNDKLRILAFGNPDRGVAMELPFAQREVLALERYFTSIKSFFSKDVTKDNILSEVGSYDVFHLASHAHFNHHSPIESGFLLASSSDQDAGDDMLTVADVMNLRLSEKLVVLSACETGLGLSSAGDEIVGLNRAFFYAGSTAVISSLWRISDVSSAVIMKRFYRYLSEGYSRAEALRKAKLVVRDYFEHPSYWSAFRLTGDFR